jgi:hypothetical protein
MTNLSNIFSNIMMTTTTLHSLKLKINLSIAKQKWQIALWNKLK